MRKRLWLAVFALVTAAAPAFATSPLDLSTVTIDTTYYFAAVLIIVTTLAVLWPVRKTIKLFNRS